MFPLKFSLSSGLLFLFLMILRADCSSWTKDPTYITGFSVVSTDARKNSFCDADRRLNAEEKAHIVLRIFGSFSPRSYFTFSRKTDCSEGGAQSKINVLEGSDDMVAEVTVTLPEVSKDGGLVYICLNGKLQGRSGSENGKESVVPWLTFKLFQNRPIPVWISLVLIAILLSLSALFSGLNLGLLSLDKTDLKVILNTGSQKERTEAAAIVPVRNHGNYLLCSLVFSNVLVNTTLTVVMDEVIMGNWETVAYTTLAIVTFGEILPQAVCCRYGLTVGAKTIWITKFFMAITFPIAYPCGKILDKMLGEEVGAVYTRDRLRELLKVTRDQHGLESEEMGIISGTLDMKRKTVKDVMTPTDQMFMIEYNAPLSRKTIANIEEKGYSRIPIYQGERWNVIGLVNVRQLTSVDTQSTPAVKDMLDKYKAQTHLFCVFENTRLDYMLKAFREGSRGHMAFVQRINDDGPGDPKYETLGLVTLEDVLEEVLQAEIYDENDVERLQLNSSSKQNMLKL